MCYFMSYDPVHWSLVISCIYTTVKRKRDDSQSHSSFSLSPLVSLTHYTYTSRLSSSLRLSFFLSLSFILFHPFFFHWSFCTICRKLTHWFNKLLQQSVPLSLCGHFEDERHIHLLVSMKNVKFKH